MAYKFDIKRKGFTFIWILENFAYCKEKTGVSFESPIFIVDTIERTKWSLSLYPRGEEPDNRISLFLNRKKDSKGSSNIEIDFELAFLASDGSILTSESGCRSAFLKGGSLGFPEFEQRESVIANHSKFLPQDTLTIRCRMWQSIGEVKRQGECIARTRIGAEKKVFLWKIYNFSTFKVGKEITFRLKSTSDDKPIMFLKLFFSNSRTSTDSLIKFVLSNKNIAFLTFKSSIVDSKGDYVKCGHHEIWFSPIVQSAECELSLPKDIISDNSYLPNNVLTLYCECAFSSGILSEVIESTSYGCSGCFITNDDVSENGNGSRIESSEVEASSGLTMDLNTMLRDNVLCDVKLCTGLEAFPAHWFILSARSPVFRAMFKSGMKEKRKDQIDIGDLRSDTVRRMLQYMYTDSLEELQWEDASDLYVAAEKYQILSLKDKCSAFLKNNLSFTNACEILLVADLHQDKKLKSVVQDYILKNDKSIINSDEWKLLMEANLNLAAETLLLRYK